MKHIRSDDNNKNNHNLNLFPIAFKISSTNIIGIDHEKTVIHCSIDSGTNPKLLDRGEYNMNI